MSASSSGAVTVPRTWLERAHVDGELVRSADPATLARFVGTITQDMSVQARDGASAADLLAVANLAIVTLEVQRA